MNKKIGAVFTGGDFQALGAIRTIARKDIPVVVLDSDLCISRYSRFVKKYFKAPSLADEKESYVDFLVNLAKEQDLHGWVIFPNSDEAVYVLSKYRDLLEKFYRIPTPSWDVIQYVYNKKKTYQLAEKHEIPIPKTFYPNNADDLLNLNLQYPVVIKPSIRDNFYNKTKIKAFRVNNREELLRIYQYICTVINPSEVLVQEFIASGTKGLFSFCPFFKDGKVITSITARRSRQHPMDFGHASTFAELTNIEEIKEISEKFLNIIGYYGIGEVEFMLDPRDNKYKFLEVNPRIWGWHTLAIAAGVDLPYLLYKDMIGEKVNMPSSIMNNVKWVRLATDLPTVFTEIVKGNMNITDYLKSMKGKKEFAVFSIDDPLPFFIEFALIPYLWKKRGF